VCGRVCRVILYGSPDPGRHVAVPPQVPQGLGRIADRLHGKNIAVSYKQINVEAAPTEQLGGIRR